MRYFLWVCVGGVRSDALSRVVEGVALVVRYAVSRAPLIHGWQPENVVRKGLQRSSGRWCMRYTSDIR